MPPKAPESKAAKAAKATAGGKAKKKVRRGDHRKEIGFWGFWKPRPGPLSGNVRGARGRRSSRRGGDRGHPVYVMSTVV